MAREKKAQPHTQTPHDKRPRRSTSRVWLEALDSAQSGISFEGRKALKERKGQKVPGVGYLFKGRAEGGELSNDSGGYCRGK